MSVTVSLAEKERPPEIYNLLWDNIYRCSSGQLNTDGSILYKYRPTKKSVCIQGAAYERIEVYFKDIYVTKKAIDYLLTTRNWAKADEREKLLPGS